MDRRRLMALTGSDVKARFADQGSDGLASSPEICSCFLGSEVDQGARVIRAKGITADG
ncbi:hypothetical protein [Neoroseomonas lacus]|nr:hypothetical protein [Neoroseomonas lacus]